MLDILKTFVKKKIRKMKEKNNNLKEEKLELLKEAIKDT